MELGPGCDERGHTLQGGGTGIRGENFLTEAASFTFSLEQDFPVKNLRPAPVRLYDYYETGESRPGPAPAPATL
uniref:Alpha-macroglobulin receptor-binding domain-containing protein n=1 Tax=Chelydra serpentina TaxID=8475 RepID=A0A8C3S8T6_CHESE